ncbi:hypothetical protein MXD60_09505 [Frankia sp. AgB32]|nr:hypothetical protein [Frankia sp. AgB32]
MHRRISDGAGQQRGAVPDTADPHPGERPTGAREALRVYLVEPIEIEAEFHDLQC